MCHREEEMPGEHASCRRRLRLASRWYLYSKMLRDKMFLVCVARTHHRARGAEMMACLEGKPSRRCQTLDGDEPTKVTREIMLCIYPKL